jgi:hypothetical protein
MAEEGRVTGQVWRWTVLASMASWIDAGSIVAGRRAWRFGSPRCT